MLSLCHIWSELRQSQTGPGWEEKGVLVSTQPLTSCLVPPPWAPALVGTMAGAGFLWRPFQVQPSVILGGPTSRWAGVFLQEKRAALEGSVWGSKWTCLLLPLWDASCHSHCPAHPPPTKLANQMMLPLYLTHRETLKSRA